MTGSANLYRFFKFNNARTLVELKQATLNLDTGLTIDAGGCTITAGGQTITAGGQTITAGGQTVTAGDVKVVGGQFFAGNKVYVGGVTTSAPCIMTGTVAPAVYGALGSIYIDTQTASLYVQTATNAWKQFATPF